MNAAPFEMPAEATASKELSVSRVAYEQTENGG
jgi:hypothetical protein